jgi:hypothetical protein
LCWDLLTGHRKVPASLSLFLKSEKNPSSGKGPDYRPFCDFRPLPSAYQPRAQISNQRRASTQVLLLYQKNLGVFSQKEKKKRRFDTYTVHDSRRQGELGWTTERTGMLSILCNSPSFFAFCWCADCRRIVWLATSSEDRLPHL